MSIVYHYTTAAGLIGILGGGGSSGIDTKKTIRMSPHQFLNDLGERRQHQKYLVEKVNELHREVSLAFLIKHRSEPLEDIIVEDLNVYDNIWGSVASFSLEPNLLNQWRSYTSSEGGYCIGFDEDVLRELAQSQGMHLGKCLYGEKEHQKSINESISHFRESLIKDEKNVDGGKLQSYMEFIHNATMRGAFLKDYHFNEEKEVRLVKFAGGNEFSYVAQKGIVKPFFEFEFTGHVGNLIKEVWIGPMEKEKQEKAMVGLSVFLNSLGIRSWKVDIKVSDIEFRF